MQYSSMQCFEQSALGPWVHQRGWHLQYDKTAGAAAAAAAAAAPESWCVVSCLLLVPECTAVAAADRTRGEYQCVVQDSQRTTRWDSPRQPLNMPRQLTDVKSTAVCALSPTSRQAALAAVSGSTRVHGAEMSRAGHLHAQTGTERRLVGCTSERRDRPEAQTVEEDRLESRWLCTAGRGGMRRAAAPLVVGCNSSRSHSSSGISLGIRRRQYAACTRSGQHGGTAVLALPQLLLLVLVVTTAAPTMTPHILLGLPI